MMTDIEMPARDADGRPTRPGWPEMAVGLIVYMGLILALGVWLTSTPDDQSSLRGIIGMAANGVAGTIALFLAWSLRIRNLRAFGFRPVEGRWLAIAVGWGVLAFGASFVIEGVYFSFITEANTQGDFQSAAKGGALMLAIIVFTGAILTPLGEEFVFRGILANGLNRYGVFAGVVISSIIFGVAHGINVILLLAFMIGVIAAILFRRTGSIYPGLVVHITYNGLHLIGYSFL